MIRITVLASLFCISLILGLILTKFFREIAIKYGKMGVDVHKIEKPLIPEMGGTSVFFTLLIMNYLCLYFKFLTLEYFLGFTFTIIIVAIIGFIDDVYKLKGVYKPLLLGLLAGLPLIYFGTYNPSIKMPFIEGFFIPIIYPFLIPLVIAVTANSFNMLDPFNGTMTTGTVIISVTLLIISYLMGNIISTVYLAVFLGAVLGLYYYNRYPSKVFTGNIGSLTIGATVGIIAIQGRMEFIVLVAILPYIMNSFFILSSIKGLKEKSEIKERPTKLLNDGFLEASTNPDAPLTVARLFLSGEKLTELQVIRRITLLFVISSLLAIFTFVMMR